MHNFINLITAHPVFAIIAVVMMGWGLFLLYTKDPNIIRDEDWDYD